MFQRWLFPVFFLTVFLFSPPIASTGASNSSSELNPIKSIHFLKNFPSDRDNGWGKRLQGVANDHQHWFFTQVDRLWKFPISHNLNTKITNDDRSKGIQSVPIPGGLKNLGYDHFGDLDYFDGYLFIPLEGGTVPPRIAVFRAANLWYIGSFPLSKQTKAGWCAIHPITKQLYSSNNSISAKDPLFVYDFDWGQLKTGFESPASRSIDHRCDNLGPKQVAFYKDKDYQGACTLLDAGHYPNSSHIGLTNDSISSIKVGSQTEVMVCRDDDMRGYCEAITENIRYLRHQNPNFLNNKISSAIVTPILSWKGSPKRPVLFDVDGKNKVTIKGYLQGGDFSEFGTELYIVDGNLLGSQKKDRTETGEGIWVFSSNSDKPLTLIMQSSQSGDFEFKYNSVQEPEGITIWSLPDGKAPGIPKSQVHVILLKKGETVWETVPLLGHPIPKPVKKWYFKHYEIFREANAAGLSDTDIAVLISII